MSDFNEIDDFVHQNPDRTELRGAVSNGGKFIIVTEGSQINRVLIKDREAAIGLRDWLNTAIADTDADI